MTEPKLEPGIYESKGKLFAYKGPGPKIELHPYFSVYIHFPDGKKEWVMEEASLIADAKRIDPEERIEELSKRQKPKNNSRLIKWLKENSDIE
jgi:hypothetical protein